MKSMDSHQTEEAEETMMNNNVEHTEHSVEEDETMIINTNNQQNERTKDLDDIIANIKSLDENEVKFTIVKLHENDALQSDISAAIDNPTKNKTKTKAKVTFKVDEAGDIDDGEHEDERPEMPPGERNGYPALNQALYRKQNSVWKTTKPVQPGSSYPFNRGYSPSKLEIESIWKPQVHEVQHQQMERPKVTLKSADEMMMFSKGNSSPVARYRIPPGTSRTRRCLETYENVIAREKWV